MTEERHFRISPRPQASHRVAIRRGDASTLIAFTKNVSTGGMFVETQESFAMGESVDVELSSPSTWEPLRLRAEVRRITADGIGLRFSDVSDSDLVALIDLTSSLNFES